PAGGILCRRARDGLTVVPGPASMETGPAPSPPGEFRVARTAGFFFAARPPQGKKHPLGGQQAAGAAWGPSFCRRAAPRQKAPPWGAASRRRSVGAFFLPPGRPKAKSAPLGGSKPKAQRGGFFCLAPGRAEKR